MGGYGYGEDYVVVMVLELSVVLFVRVEFVEKVVYCVVYCVLIV